MPFLWHTALWHIQSPPASRYHPNHPSSLTPNSARSTLDMKSVNTKTRERASCRSSGPGAPSQMKPSEGSSSVHTTGPRPLPPPSSAITRPTMYTHRYSWEDTSEDDMSPQSQLGTAAESTFGQPRLLSYSYNTFMGDLRSMEQHSISMPDHNEYVELIVARGRRDGILLQSPPYPLHGQNTDRYSASAIHGNGGGILRQPTAEDFMRTDHPLPAPPPEEHDSDQDLPVIEPDSYLPEDFANEHEPQHTNTQPQQSCVAVPKRRSTTANALAHPKLEMRPNYKHSQSELIPPSHAPALTYEPTMPEHYSTPECVPTIGVDMYQPALGGLQMVSGLQRSESKRNRIRRFMCGLNPFHRKRKFGRQRGTKKAC